MAWFVVGSSLLVASGRKIQWRFSPSGDAVHIPENYLKQGFSKLIISCYCIADCLNQSMVQLFPWLLSHGSTKRAATDYLQVLHSNTRVLSCEEPLLPILWAGQVSWIPAFRESVTKFRRMFQHGFDFCLHTQ